MKQSKLSDNQPFTPSFELLPVSIQLILKHFDSLLWLLFIPLLIGGLGSQLITNVIGSQPMGTLKELQDAGRFLLGSSTGQTGIGLLGFSYLWLFVTYPATIVLAYRAVHRKTIDIRTCLRESRHFFVRIYLVNIIAAIVIMAGFLAFIIPGFFMLRRYYLATYELLRSDAGVFETLANVHRRTLPFAGYVWGLLFVTFIINLAAAALSDIPLLGFVLSSALSYSYFFAPALRYREIAATTVVDDKK